jgi:hypothetical protein
VRDEFGRHEQRNANFAFSANGAIFKFHFDHLDSYLEGCSKHSISMMLQKDFQAPLTLFLVCSGESIGTVKELPEADVWVLLGHMGLVSTTPPELFAFLLSIADPSQVVSQTSCNLVFRDACTKWDDNRCSFTEGGEHVCLACHSAIQNREFGLGGPQLTYKVDQGGGKFQVFTSFAPIVSAAVAVIRGQSLQREGNLNLAVADEEVKVKRSKFLLGEDATHENRKSPKFSVEEEGADDKGTDENRKVEFSKLRLRMKLLKKKQAQKQ